MRRGQNTGKNKFDLITLAEIDQIFIFKNARLKHYKKIDRIKDKTN